MHASWYSAVNADHLVTRRRRSTRAARPARARSGGARAVGGVRAHFAGRGVEAHERPVAAGQGVDAVGAVGGHGDGRGADGHRIPGAPPSRGRRGEQCPRRRRRPTRGSPDQRDVDGRAAHSHRRGPVARPVSAHRLRAAPAPSIAGDDHGARGPPAPADARRCAAPRRRPPGASTRNVPSAELAVHTAPPATATSVTSGPPGMGRSAPPPRRRERYARRRRARYRRSTPTGNRSPTGRRPPVRTAGGGRSPGRAVENPHRSAAGPATHTRPSATTSPVAWGRERGTSADAGAVRPRGRRTSAAASTSTAAATAAKTSARHRGRLLRATGTGGRGGGRDLGRGGARHKAVPARRRGRWRRADRRGGRAACRLPRGGARSACGCASGARSACGCASGARSACGCASGARSAGAASHRRGTSRSGEEGGEGGGKGGAAARRQGSALTALRIRCDPLQLLRVFGVVELGMAWVPMPARPEGWARRYITATSARRPAMCPTGAGACP